MVLEYIHIFGHQKQNQQVQKELQMTLTLSHCCNSLKNHHTIKYPHGLPYDLDVMHLMLYYMYLQYYTCVLY